MTKDLEALIDRLAAKTCNGNRHEGFVGNCPVCLDRWLDFMRIAYACRDEMLTLLNSLGPAKKRKRQKASLRR